VKKQTLVVAVVLAGVASAAVAGVKYKLEDGAYMELGGRIQLQYHYQDPQEGEATDEVFFRRLRPYIKGGTEDWEAKFQWDMGKGDIEIKDAYYSYKGFDAANVILGNYSFPFSREFLTSSKKQQLVERTFVGDHNYGTPDRQAGVHLVGEAADGKFGWGASVAKAAVDPDTKKLDFDTVASLTNDDEDFQQGTMYGARIDVHPFGKLKFAQGDFKRELKTTLSVAGFAYESDDQLVGGDALDNTYTKGNVDSVTGLEVSGAIRYGGLSIDAQYNSFESELLDLAAVDEETGEPTGEIGPVTSGLYRNGETTLESYAIEGGFMVIADRLEVVGGFQSQDADNYETSWDRTSVGANLFVDGHNVKYQFTYRMGENKNGEKGADEDEVFVQAQYVF